MKMLQNFFIQVKQLVNYYIINLFFKFEININLI